VSRFVTFSSHVNAWSLGKGLRRLGRELTCLGPEGGLVPSQTGAVADDDVLFFTEEWSLRRFLGSSGLKFKPRRIDGPLDDKLAFARLMDELGETNIPYWEVTPETLSTPPSLPIFLKARHSWIEGKKVTRGYVCWTRHDVEEALGEIAASGLSPNDFFFQELLDPDQIDCISVCGYFDHSRPGHRLLLATHKVIGDADVIATGTLVESLALSPGLARRACAILERLGYVGAFELEFLEHRGRGVAYALELNPRFWMQHGLFIDHVDNLLIRLYLDLVPADTSVAGRTKGLKVVWADGLMMTRHFVRLRWRQVARVLRILVRRRRQGYAVSIYPGFTQALGFVVGSFIARRRRR
jgi:hypothetical protein